jgi:hypothetical protein
MDGKVAKAAAVPHNYWRAAATTMRKHVPATRGTLVDEDPPAADLVTRCGGDWAGGGTE